MFTQWLVLGIDFRFSNFWIESSSSLINSFYDRAVDSDLSPELFVRLPSKHLTHLLGSDKSSGPDINFILNLNRQFVTVLSPFICTILITLWPIQIVNKTDAYRQGDESSSNEYWPKILLYSLPLEGKFFQTLFNRNGGHFAHRFNSRFTHTTRSPWMLRTGACCQLAFHSGVLTSTREVRVR